MLGWRSNILSPDVKTNRKNPKNLSASKINVLGLSDFLKNDVRKRKHPVKIDEDDPPRVLMKMNIEGSEIDVNPDLIFTRDWQYLNKLMIEWHERLEREESRKQTHNILHSVTTTLSKYSELIYKEKGHLKFSLIDL